MSERLPMEQWLNEQPFGDAVAMTSLVTFAREQDAALAAKDARIAELEGALRAILNTTDYATIQAKARAALAPKEAQQ